YWWGVPGKMKTFIDRLYFYHSSHNKKLIAGKKAMVFSPMNMNSDNPRIDIFKNFYDILFDNLDLKFVGGYYFGNVNEKGALVKRSEYMEQINDLGKNLNQYFD
ncbi:MAG: hypothetical protein HKM93_12300, partial [Desulfobacteraceae bacterium]|nr:hypothetical protein [Desulfobacteraceae bacterium]